MRLLTPQQALALDQKTFEDRDFLSVAFIHEAALGVVKAIKARGWDSRKILFLVGPGNNGADAVEVARLLGLPDTHCYRLNEFEGVPPFSEFDLIVDGLFGVGLNRPLDGQAKLWVDELNALSKTVVSIDSPSGLDGLTGWPRGTAVRASLTITFQAAKPGFFQNVGPEHTGQLVVHPLPYAKHDFTSIASTHFACGERALKKLLPNRSRHGNKGSFGRIQLVAGSSHYPGAAVLAARAALRCGVGSVRVIQFESVYPDWFQIPETLFTQWQQIPKDLDIHDTWVIGPGVTDLSSIEKLLERLREAGAQKVIVDASALSVLKKSSRPWPSTWLMTPHPKELSDLLQVSTERIQRNRFEAIERATEKWGGVFLLKGYKTLVSTQGHFYVLLRGDSSLAKAGSGDVLSGIVGAFRAQGRGALESAVGGGLLHAWAANLWCQSRDAASLLPSDLIETLPLAQKQLRT